MKTITLEIGKLTSKGKYPLRLWEGEIGTKKLAEATIPKDLQVAGLQHDPNQFSFYVLTTPTAEPKFGEIGADLLLLLSQGRVGETWAKLRQENTQLRTCLAIAETTLQLLPWELLNDQETRLCLQEEQPIIRAVSYQASTPGAATTSLSWPLRVLVVVGSKDPNIGVAQELELIEDVLRPVNRTIDVEVCLLPTKPVLLKAVETFCPHIFHFIGHSGQNVHQEMVLRFEGKGENDPDDYWTAAEIKNSQELKEIKPRFVFLNSCRSGNAAALDDQKSVLLLSAAFRTRGIPAVLAMQADVQGEHAGRLAGEIYRGLAAGDPLDVALVRARGQVINNMTNGLLSREWALPSLTLSLPPEEILSIQAQATDVQRVQWAQKIDVCPIFKEVIPQFVNRKAHRRSIVQGFYPITLQVPEKHLMIIRGKSGIGKSWIVHWCLESCARQGHNVRYVPIVDTTGKEWLDVLLQIRDGDPDRRNSLIHEPLEPAAFAEFNWELHHRLQGKEEIPRRNGAVIAPPRRQAGQRLEDLGEHFAKKTFASFRSAVQQAAKGQPLILALDDFTKDVFALPEAHLQKFLIPHLLSDLVAGDLKPIKIILIMTEAEYNTIYQIEHSSLRGSYHEVSLSAFKKDEFALLAWEFVRSFPHLKNSPAQKLRKLIESWENIFIDADWEPTQLKDFLERIKNKPDL